MWSDGKKVARRGWGGGDALDTWTSIPLIGPDASPRADRSRAYVYARGDETEMGQRTL